MLLCLFYARPIRSQIVYHSITVTLASCRLLCHSNIYTLLLSRVPWFVSASRCSCSLMCLALSQHHAAQPSCRHYSYVALSQYCFFMCFVSASLTPFLLYLSLSLSLSHVPKLPCYRSCSFMYIALSQHHAALTLSPAGYMITLLLLSHVPCFVRLSITLLCQVLRLSITLLMCLALSQHDITPLFSALPFPDYMIFDRLRHVVVN